MSIRSITKFCILLSLLSCILCGTPTVMAAMNLDAPVTANFQNTDIREVMQTLAAASQGSITVSSNVTAKVTAQFTNKPFKEAFKSVVAQAGLQFKRVGDVIYVYLPGQPPGTVTASSGNNGNNGNNAPRVIKLKYIKAEQMKTSLSVVVPEDRIRTVSPQNALIVNATDEEYNKIRNVLSELDTPPKQVMFEAEVVEMAQSTVSQFGVSWKWSTYPSPPDSPLPGLVEVSKLHNLYVNFQGTLDALVTSKKAKILANPRVAALDGETAYILIGDRLPVETKYLANGVQQVSVSYIDVGIKLRVTPWINEDGIITTKIRPEVSTNIATDGNNPSIRTREAETTLRVKNGETIVIGGLIQNEDRKNISKFPLLGDLPLVGRLFKNTGKEKRETELVIFITPKIIE